MTERSPKALAIIPVRERDVAKTGGMPLLGGRPLLAYTVDMAKRSRLLDRVIVSTDSDAVRQLAVELGAEAPFLRPVELSAPGVPLERVLAHALEWLRAHDDYQPDIVVRLEISHPFREEGLIDRVIQTLIEQDLDTVFTAYEERHNFWKVGSSGELEPVADDRDTRERRPPIYKEMSGMVCATLADVIRSGQRLGDRVGVVPLSSLQALVDTQDAQGLELAHRLLDEPSR